jgi:DNA-binding MarR family transcriptional regulator
MAASLSPFARRVPSSDAGDRDDELRRAMELLFYAYRDFIAEPDKLLQARGFGRAHHRVVHFVGRNPGITVNELLAILKITKQSLGRVLGQLIREGIVQQETRARDKRHRHLTLTPQGQAFEERVSADQRNRIAAAFAAVGPAAALGFEEVLRHMINDSGDLARFDREPRAAAERNQGA